jgi:polyhydroxyalkanoate synthesis regulator phasin
MNTNDIFQNVQKGFRVTLGAAGTLVDSLQNPRSGEEALNKLRTNPDELVEELATKGEMTEQEARNFVDGLLSSTQTAAPGNAPGRRSNDGAPTAPPDIQADLQVLTTQIAELRKELQSLSEQDNK